MGVPAEVLELVLVAARDPRGHRDGGGKVGSVVARYCYKGASRTLVPEYHV